MYTQEVFRNKVKEWLLGEKLNPVGNWSIEKDPLSINSVCISVELPITIGSRDEKVETSNSANSNTIDDEKKIKETVLELYFSVCGSIDNTIKEAFGI